MEASYPFYGRAIFASGSWIVSRPVDTRRNRWSDVDDERLREPSRLSPSVGRPDRPWYRILAERTLSERGATREVHQRSHQDRGVARGSPISARSADRFQHKPVRRPVASAWRARCASFQHIVPCSGHELKFGTLTSGDGGATAPLESLPGPAALASRSSSRRSSRRASRPAPGRRRCLPCSGADRLGGSASARTWVAYLPATGDHLLLGAAG